MFVPDAQQTDSEKSWAESRFGGGYW